MAVVVVTPTNFAVSVASATLPSSAGVVTTTNSDGWSVTIPRRGSTDKLILLFLDSGATDSITVKKGDYKPGPAFLANKGDLTFALAASETKYLVLESGRFEQDDDTVTITCTGANTTKLSAFTMPYAQGGGSAIA